MKIHKDPVNRKLCIRALDKSIIQTKNIRIKVKILHSKILRIKPESVEH